jgi:hypothetical protein
MLMANLYFHFNSIEIGLCVIAPWTNRKRTILVKSTRSLRLRLHSRRMCQRPLQYVPPLNWTIPWS